MFTVVTRLARAILDVLVFVNAAALLVLLCALAADIVIRYVEHSSIFGLHEVTSVAFSALYLLGSVEVYARRKDVDLDVISPRLHGRTRHAYDACRNLVLAAAFVLLAWYSIKLIGGMSGDRSPLLGIPTALYQWPVAIGAILIALYSLLDAIAGAIGVATGVRPVVIEASADDEATV